MRKPDFPVAKFPDIHYNGILSVSWSLNDPSLVVSSAQDFKTIVTNFKTGEPMLEFPTESKNLKVEWSKQLKGKIATMDDEGNS